MKRFPKLIAEVLSPSTEEFDRGTKFEDYQSLESLEESALISQDQMWVECQQRVTSNSGQWETEIYGEGEQVFLRSIGLKVAIDDLYRGVNSNS